MERKETDGRGGREELGGKGNSDEVRRFDELYSELCEELRDSGKSMDLCEQIRVVSSDLSRIQVFLTSFPKTVEKFTNSIRRCYQKKSEIKSRDLLEEAKSGRVEGEKSLQTLTSALCLAPWEGIRVEDLEKTKSLDSCIEYLVARVIVSGEEDKRNSHPEKEKAEIESNDPPTQLVGLSGEAEWSASPSSPLPQCVSGVVGEERTEKVKKAPGNDLLSEIYFERAAWFWGKELCENALLEFGRALICCGERSRDPAGSSSLTFTQIYMIGQSLKMVGFLDEGEKVLHEALTHLRRFSGKLDNETKGRETLRIVKLLKEIKSTREEIVKSELRGRKSENAGTKGRSNDGKGGKVSTGSPSWPGQLYGNPNGILLAASDVLLLKEDNKRGRYVQARKTIPPGATLIVDVPYSWSIYPRLYSDLCQHCCRKVGSGIPCQRCSAVVFCKWECWEKSEAYHKLECSILKNLDSSEALGEMGVLCYRTIAKTRLAVVLKWAEEVENQSLEMEGGGGGRRNEALFKADTSSISEDAPKKWNHIRLGLNDLGKLDPTDFASVLGLSPNTSVRPGGDIAKRTIIAIYLTLCLRYVGYFKEDNPSDSSIASFSRHGGDSIDPHLPHASHDKDRNRESASASKGSDPNSLLSRTELLTAGLILRISQALTCNAYGVNGTLKLRDEARGGIQQVDNFGGALYPSVSAINHSCNPNVFRVSWGKTCLVRSIGEIQEGEEVRDSYGPLYSWMERKKRKALLKSQYFFDCDCGACEGDWPTFRDLVKTQPSSLTEETVYKCSSCSTRVELRKSKSQCVNCGQVWDGKRLMKVLKESEKKYKSGKELLLRDGNINPGTVQHITHHIATLQRSLPQPHKLILEAQEALKLLWNLEIQDADAFQNPELT